MKSDDITRFGIVVIESLSSDELQTGQSLCSTTLKYKSFAEKNLHIGHFQVNSKDEFLNRLTDLVNEAIDKNYFYFLHFEIHGYDGGIEICNGELVSWEELFPLLRGLNIHYRNLLVLHLAVCKGASLLKYIDPTERSAFRAILASPLNIQNRDILNGFEQFYSHFFFSFDPIEALKKYNEVVENEDSKLSLISCEYCFDAICDIERKTADKPKLLESLKQIFYQNNPDKISLPEQELYGKLETEIQRIFKDLKEYREYFLMKDLI
jgi:hypothetical protein